MNYYFTDWQRGYQECRKDARIEAFGAIRRAAEVAREFDRDAKTLQKRCHLIVDGKQSGDIARLNYYRMRLRIEAAIVRRAIRAAIGSEKA